MLPVVVRLPAVPSGWTRDHIPEITKPSDRRFGAMITASLPSVRGRRTQPLRRAAPGRLVATPGWLLLATTAVALLTAAIVAPGLFARAADDAALDAGLAAVDEDAFASTSVDVRATWIGVLPDASEQVVRRALTRLPTYGRPVVTAQGTAANRLTTPIVEVRGRDAQPSVLYYRDGAVEALGGTAGTTGVWLAAEVAEALGVGPGDQVRFGLEKFIAPGEGKRAAATVAGTFQRSRGSALPQQLADDPRIARRDLPWDPDQPGTGRPIAIADHATFDRLVLAIGELPLWNADLELPAGVTPGEASAAAREIQRLSERAFNESSRVASATLSAEPAPTRLQVVSGLPDVVFDARRTADAAESQAAPFATAAVALALAVVAAATLLLGRSRVREQHLLSGLGMRPAEVAWLAALEWLLPAVAGALLGGGLAWATVAATGPPGDLSGGESGAAVLAAVAGALAVAVASLCAGVTAWVTDRRALSSRLGRPRRRIPWEAVVLVAAVTAGVAVTTTAVGARPSSPLAVAFPLLLATAVGLLVLRGLQAVTARRPGSAQPATPRGLAVLRSRAARSEVGAVTLALAVGLGVLGYSLAAHRGVTQGVDDKVAALVGSRTVVDVGDGLSTLKKHPPRRPASPVPGGSVVFRQVVTVPPTFGAEPLMAVDITTFADTADWGTSGKLDAGRQLLPKLRRAPGAKELPVLIVGDTDMRAGDQGTMVSYEEWYVPFVVAGVVEAFPGSETDAGDIALVADAASLWKWVPKPVDPRRTRGLTEGAGGMSTWVWSTRSPTAVATTLDRADIQAQASLVRTTAATRPELQAAGWSSGYVVALGAAALLLVAAATLTLAVRFADRDAMADVVLGRMGFRPADLARSRTWEVVAVVAAALVAAAFAVAALAIAPTTVEPAADLPPLTRPAPAPVDAAVLLAVGVLLVAGSAAVARRRAATRDPAEVLRGDG